MSKDTSMQDKSRDSELLDKLDKYLKENGALLIHQDGYDAIKRPAGLGLTCTGRTLRKALESL